MFMIALLSALLSYSPAQAATCPWTKVDTVSTTMTTLFINGTVYPVKGSPVTTTKTESTDVTSMGAIVVGSTSNTTTSIAGTPYRETVYAMLDACGNHAAAEDLRRWRANRRSFNWSILGLACTYGLAAPWTVVAGIRAGQFRHQLEYDLRNQPAPPAPPPAIVPTAP